MIMVFLTENQIAITVYETTEKKFFTKTEKITKGLDSLCHDLKSLCIQRDQLFQELNDIQVPVQEIH